MQFHSISKVNSLFYLSMLKWHEHHVIQDNIRELKPFCESIGLPFVHHNIHDRDELIGILDGIKIAAEGGLLPLIHLVAHGASGGGIAIADQNAMMYWDELCQYMKQINIACRNNLCVVANTCFGFELAGELKITESVPFYILIAPEKILKFSYFIANTTPFYKAVFSGLDIIAAHQMHMSDQMTLFHCEKFFSVVFGRYTINHCRGEGRARRLEHLVELAMQGGRFDNTSDMRQRLRILADQQIGPTQEQLDRYAATFLIGKPTAFKLNDILKLIESNGDGS